MTNKQIDLARECRLWIGQVLVPVIGTGVSIISNPNVRQLAKEKMEAHKEKRKKRNLK